MRIMLIRQVMGKKNFRLADLDYLGNIFNTLYVRPIFDLFALGNQVIFGQNIRQLKRLSFVPSSGTSCISSSVYWLYKPSRGEPRPSVRTTPVNHLSLC